MHSVLALARAAFLAASSYRLAMLISIGGLLLSVVPLYFVSGALQPVVQASIAAEGGQYFGFLIVGTAALTVAVAAAGAIPGALAGSIGSGTFEAFVATRTPLPTLLLGMAAYPLAWTMARAGLLVGGAALIGVGVHWPATGPALLVLALMVAAYGGIGLVAGALVLVFRTSGPLLTGVTALSALLGGVYYSTTVIPAWLRTLSDFVPLSYALRPIRGLLLGGAPMREVAPDIATLALFAVTLLAIGTLAFGAALRHARHAGTLSQY